jgi:hypothetical protein
MKLVKYSTLLIFIVGCTMLSCKKKEYSLPGMPDKSQIDMEVKQDLTVDAGGNTVYLTNNTSQVEPLWDYSTGKSTRQADTVHYAFTGDYTIKRTAVTGGGLVELDPVVIHVTKDNLNYVNDPLWLLLSGGPGNEKTWQVDLDANGVSKVFDGPVYYAGDEIGWAAQCTKPNGNCWTWFPKWADNTWICPKGDYGTMTFSLKGGPFVKVDQKMISSSGVTSGTYYLDKDAKTISFSGVTPLNIGLDQVFTKGTLISLTDKSMQIAFKNPTKAEVEIYNYIAQ